MPELPEVETVRRGLVDMLGEGAGIARIELMRADLRAPIPMALPQRLAGQPVTAVRRRAKYLLIDTPAGSLLCHLGMTGCWRLAPPGDEREHDHCYVHLADGRRLAFRDPRRFGMLDLVEPGGDTTHPALSALGPEPLDAGTFTPAVLAAACRKRRAPIKALIMDQAVVVGIGNIYANEGLFRAGIRPQRAAGRLRSRDHAALVSSLRRVLREALAAGGSSINDFRHAGGELGCFQHSFRVYDRAGAACGVCATRIRVAVVAGRSTFWCPTCQP